ncbi:MAG: methyltransferase domain-containing protein [Melioribacteraceae bacterium]|nr:methyltransferase domain-containing protein [Melioribacteraceae bacterium]
MPAKISFSDYILEMSIKIFNSAANLLSDNQLSKKPCFSDIENYLLAGYVKTYTPQIIIEINTNSQSSALALQMYLENGKIITFNSHDRRNNGFGSLSEKGFEDGQIKQFINDITKTSTFEKYNEIFQHADLIYINSPDYDECKMLLENFSSVQFTGYPKMIINNIYNEKIKNLWDNIDQPKFDLSAFGSTSGIGIIEWEPLKSALEELPEEQRFKKLHVGCGNQKFKGFINMDARPTPATDLINDCSNFKNFPDSHFSLVYSHAFFEHLWADQELSCLKDINRILNENGKVLFLGLPDFKIIADAYINKKEGLTSEKFDLLQAYRLTHGSPEQSENSWKLEQLHKAIFDTDTLNELLKAAGYKSYTVFNYCFRDEKLPVNLGFIAYKNQRQINISLAELSELIKKITYDVNHYSIKILLQQ